MRASRFTLLIPAAGMLLAAGAVRAAECGPQIDGPHAISLAEEGVAALFTAVDSGVADPFEGRLSPELEARLAGLGPPGDWLTRGAVGEARRDFSYQHIYGVRATMTRAVIAVRWKAMDDSTVRRSFTLICRDERWRFEGMTMSPEGLRHAAPEAGTY